MKTLKREILVEKMQDNDGHWYWIPLSLVIGFRDLLDHQRNDDIELLFGDFRTNGHPDNKPEAFV